MRIVIDLQGAQTESRYRGIGRYCIAVAKAIAKKRRHHEVFILLNGLIPGTIDSVRAEFDGLLPQDNIRIWYAPGPIRDMDPANRHARIMANHVREAVIHSINPDVIYVTSLFEGYMDDAVSSMGTLGKTIPVAATLYDLIPLLDPTGYLDPNPLYKRHYLQLVDDLQRCDLLLAISEASRLEGLAHLEINPENVVNISTAVGSEFIVRQYPEVEKSELLARFGIKRSFALYTGGADSRKNLAELIKAYASLSSDVRSSHQLVFAGRMPDSEISRYRLQAQRSGLADDELCIIGYVDDQELVALYNLCTVFVFPSLHEGFGLPALEAMACGAPVIASNTSSIPEVVGNEAALFDPRSTPSIAALLGRVLSYPDLRAALRASGLARAKLFSWEATADRVWQAFEIRFGLPRGETSDTEQVVAGLVSTIASLPFINEEFTQFTALAQAIDLSLQAEHAERQLLVDISELVKHDGKSGIQRVVRSLIREWVHNAPPGFAVVPVHTRPGEFGYRYANEFIHRVMDLQGAIGDDDPVSYRRGDVFLGLDLLLDVLPKQRAYYDAMREHGVQVYFVVYDLLLINFAHCFVEGLKHHYDQWLNTLIHYDGALCISATVADELREWLAANGPERKRPFAIGWFHLGADIDQSMPSKGIPEDPQQRLDVLSDSPTFLMVGTIEPRKGHLQTLLAFDLLWSQAVDVNLVIVGKHGWLVDALVERLKNHPELGKRLLWLNGVSDQYLEQAYRSSSCLIAASEGEGFGLPLIEAAQHKLPIFARDLPVFQEVAGVHAHYFSGHTPESIAEEIKVWLELYAKGEHPNSDNMPWLTWKQSAAQLVSVIGELAK